MPKSKKNIRFGEEKYNKQGCLMKIVEYNRANDIIVEFQDEYKAKVHTNYKAFQKRGVHNPYYRVGKENINYQNCLMKIVKYKNTNDITVEFQDDYKAKIKTNYNCFIDGIVKNPYHPSICNIGITGMKYKININGKHTKEYSVWTNLIHRSFDLKTKEEQPAYKDVTCCREWLLFENFYEWLHSQENFEKWHDNDRWCIDKDILIKGNKIYSPETCCLVPNNVNVLFTKCDKARGKLPIGVCKNGSGFQAWCSNRCIDTKQPNSLGTYNTPEEAFYLGYKPYKESYIKQMAKIEFDKGNITKKCYEAMMNYEVEITD